jgi:BirA family biotin operon repressor/biotin-[acetyl-CoA-carboxylase] ligase
MEILRYEIVESTNKIAKELIKTRIYTNENREVGEAHTNIHEDTDSHRYSNYQLPVCIVAEKQTQGKGRLGRRWISEKGGLYLSIITGKIDLPSLRGCWAVARTIERLTTLRPMIKWPNDVIVRDKKISGILTESVISHQSSFISKQMTNDKCQMTNKLTNQQTNKLIPTPSHLCTHAPLLCICGIGVNLNQNDFSQISDATSIKMETGKVVGVDEFLSTLLCYFEKTDFSLERIRDYLFALGKRVSVNSGAKETEGIFVDIANDGSLVLREDSGIIRNYKSNEVRYLR